MLSMSEATMADFQVILHISEAIYERAQRIAEQTAQPVERVLEARLDRSFDDLTLLPLDEQDELVALCQLSDEVLRTRAAEKMPRTEQDRMSFLLALSKRAALSDAEMSELDGSLKRGDRLMLRKAEAAAALAQRGYPVTGRVIAAHE